MSKEPPTGHNPRKNLKILAAICLLITTGIVIGLWFSALNDTAVKPPKHIVEQAHFPIYLPGKLPGNYKVENNSFTFDEKVLIFKATDGTGGIIAITEQPKPKDFNFDNFHKQQLKEGQTLSGTPYPSIYGLTLNGDTKLVSIVTNDTWIIASSQSTLNKEDLALIAQHIKVHEK